MVETFGNIVSGPETLCFQPQSGNILETFGNIVSSPPARPTPRAYTRARARIGFRGAGGRPARQYFGWHGICVRIGYRLSSLDMGPCAWRRRLGAILGRGARTSTIRVLGLGLGLGLGLDTRLMQSRCIAMIALMQVRGSQVSMGAEGGSNALSTENGYMHSPELQ